MKPLQHWQQLAPREQRALTLAGAVLLLGMLWQWGLGPAWKTLSEAATRRSALLNELAQMQSLADRAKALQTQPSQAPAQAQALLQEAARERLGAQATVQITGDQAQVQFKGASAQQLSLFLSQARLGSAARVTQSRMQRSTAPDKAPPGTSAHALWDGQITLQLPAGG